MEPSPLAHSIVDNGQLSTADLISTLLMYFTAPTVSDDEERYRHYTLCKPALLRLHAEDAVGFVRVAKRIKEQLGIPVGDIKRDMALLWATQASAQVPQGSNPDDGQGLIVELATAILHDEHFAQDAGGKLYAYEGGAYRPGGERRIRQRVKALLTDWDKVRTWSSHKAKEVVAYICVDAPLLWECPPCDKINLLNGILDLQTKELQPHSPSWLSPAQLPIQYDPTAKCPAWDKFVKDVFPPDARRLAYEIPADLMTPARSQQKAILFTGEGGNGKSTYLTALIAFLGKRNVSGLSLQKMESDRFAASRLLGKLANICPDLPGTHLTSTSVFKAVTGGDPLSGEYKYGDLFEFTPYARLVFSANRPPRSSDDSEAFFQRWLVMPFDCIFRGTKKEIPRSVLDARLAAPRELSGVLNKALAVLPALRKRGFTESESMNKAREEFRRTTSPLAVWLDQHTVSQPDALVAKDALVTAYNAHCDKAGQPGLTSKAFGLALKRLRPGLGEAQRTFAGKLAWVWLGIGLKTADFSIGSPSPSPPTSRDSRDSRDSTNCSFAGEEKGEKQKSVFSGAKNNNRGNPVNRVNAVNGNDLTTERQPPVWVPRTKQ